jgi:hypothetical protein
LAPEKSAIRPNFLTETKMAFLTEAEVAARLGCSLAKVKRLRVTGKPIPVGTRAFSIAAPQAAGDH